MQRDFGVRYLLMYSQGRFHDIDFRPVAKWENPWFAHSQYMDKDKFGSRLVAAFDLAHDFEEQLSADVADAFGIEALESHPQIHIPDSINKTAAISRRGSLKLVVDNT